MSVDPKQAETSAARSVRIAGYVITAYLLFSIAGVVVQVLLIVFAGLLVATFLDATASELAKRLHLPRKLALALVCLTLAGGTAAFWIMILPSLTRELEALWETLPLALDRLAATLGQKGWGSSLVQQIQDVDKLAANETALRSAGSFVRTMLAGLGAAALTGFIGLFVAVEPGQYRRGLIRLVPLHRRDRFDSVLDDAVTSLRRWLLATMFAMLVVGVLTYVGLKVLGVPLAFSLAVLAALFTFIPNVGPVIAAVPAVLLGFLTSNSTALFVAGLYLGIQLLETYLITPLVQRRLLAMPPALILVAQAIMGVFGGLVGVVVATPLMLVTIILVKKLYVEDVLERGPSLQQTP
jgi:predicted PurR-regulated permease PerM